MTDTKFHGTLGDVNPIEHDGGVVYDSGYGVEVLYFQNAEEDSRVTVIRFAVKDDAVDDLSWADWDAVASFIGMDVDEFKGDGASENPVTRARVYEGVGGYHGFSNLDSYPREMTRDEAEAEYGPFVDEAHEALKKSA